MAGRGSRVYQFTGHFVWVMLPTHQYTAVSLR